MRTQGRPLRVGVAASKAQTSTPEPRASLPRRDRVTGVALGAGMVVAVPFAVTGLVRLGLNALVVAVLCLAAAGGLVAIPRRGPWLAVGWLVGCALWAIALAVVLWQFGRGSR